MASIQAIYYLINQTIDNFNQSIPTLQKDLLDSVLKELREIDLTSTGNIVTSVKNVQLFGKIKSQLSAIILNPDYVSQVKNFVSAFGAVSDLQFRYWKKIEDDFKPPAVLQEIEKQSIDTTLTSLTESGIDANISDEVSQILQTNIGAGGSFEDLQQQLKTLLSPNNGLLIKYTKQITTDALNQYSANYTKIVSDHLGFEWYGYRGTDIVTTRPFCLAMTNTPDLLYFHVSQVPGLLKAQNLYYDKAGVKTKVPLYRKTGLPQGMPEGENSVNFFILRGGYNCRHQIGPVPTTVVPKNIQDKIYATPEFILWKTGVNQSPVSAAALAKPVSTPAPPTQVVVTNPQPIEITTTPKQRKPRKPKAAQKVPVSYEEGLTAMDNLKNSFTSKETNAVYSYTGSDYKVLNKFLRYGTWENSYGGNLGAYDIERYKALIKPLDSFLEKGQPIAATTYRMLSFEKSENYNSFLQNAKDGITLKDPGFMSTSISKERAMQGFSNYQYDNVFLTIHGKSGIPVQNYSGIKRELEVLFGRNSQFKILDYRESTVKDIDPNTDEVGKLLHITIQEL